MPKAARSAFAAADAGRAQILVPSIVLVESVFLVQRQRVPESVLNRLLALSDVPDTNIYVVPLDLAVARTVRDFGPSALIFFGRAIGPNSWPMWTFNSAQCALTTRHRAHRRGAERDPPQSHDSPRRHDARVGDLQHH